MADHIVELEADHPGFNDADYRQRRDEIATLAPPLDSDIPPQRVEYTGDEARTWATVFQKLTALYPSHACREFVAVAGDIGYSQAFLIRLDREHCLLVPHPDRDVWAISGTDQRYLPVVKVAVKQPYIQVNGLRNHRIARPRHRQDLAHHVDDA